MITLIVNYTIKPSVGEEQARAQVLNFTTQFGITNENIKEKLYLEHSKAFTIEIINLQKI